MATEADHIALVNKNHDALLYLTKNIHQFPEWVAVVAFYKAVRIVEAVFVHRHGRCCHGHQRRLERLKALGYKDLHRDYRVLWSASSIARYLYDTSSRRGYSSFADYLPADKVAKSLLKKRLYALECNAVNLLSDEARRNLSRLSQNIGT